MVNVGEDRARNGVTDCPESRNEEIFFSKYWILGLVAVRDGKVENSSRYAMDQNIWNSPDFFAVREALFWPPSLYATSEAVQWIIFLHQFHAEV